jgi:hypothetical protein
MKESYVKNVSFFKHPLNAAILNFFFKRAYNVNSFFILLTKFDKVRKYLLIIIFAIASKSFGQNLIYYGNKKYTATSIWTFKCENYFWVGDLDVQIAKTNNGGYLKVAIEVPTNDLYIGSSVFIFLEDGTIITCSDKGIRDYLDKQSIALYVLTQAEMEKLKSINISKIRFKIKTKYSKYNQDPGSFTAYNHFEVMNLNYKGLFDKNKTVEKEKDYYETSISVSALYD